MRKEDLRMGDGPYKVLVKNLLGLSQMIDQMAKSGVALETKKPLIMAGQSQAIYTVGAAICERLEVLIEQLSTKEKADGG